MQAHQYDEEDQPLPIEWRCVQQNCNGINHYWVRAA